MSNHTQDGAQPGNSGGRKLGLPMIGIIALALLAVPRVVLHDLGVITEGTWVNAIFVFVPPLIWIAVMAWWRVSNPFLTLVAVGACYGVFLAIGHQLLWHTGTSGQPPRLGGNLAGIDPGVQELIVRFFASVSSLVTGAVVGVIAGLLAWGLQAGMRRITR